MKHNLEVFHLTPPSSDIEQLVEQDQRQQMEEIQLSNKQPFVSLAYLSATIYLIILIFVGYLIRAIKRTEPSELVKKLSNLYYFVPEMTLHKAIELEEILEIPFEDKVGLDLGSGNGFVGSFIIEKYKLKKIIGIDLSSHNREACLQAGYNDFITSDIATLPLEDKSIDFAYSICVLEHVKQLKKGLEEIARVIKPGGTLTYTTPSPGFRNSTLGYTFFKMLGMNSHAQNFQKKKDISSIQFHYLSAHEWQSVLGEVGFHNVSVKPIFSKNQLLVYDMLNIQAYSLKTYFADKLYRRIKPNSRLQQLISGAISHIVTYMLTQYSAPQHTHWLIKAERK